jgi:hypothetical protein
LCIRDAYFQSNINATYLRDRTLEGAFHRLAAATQEFQSGREGGDPTMDWLLAQVDFAVEVLAQEDVNWDADQRSKLLELLLGVANLSEYIRHSTVAAQLPD